MQILFLGGTRFIGRYAVQSALSRGHQVTIVHRGKHKANFVAPVREIIVDRSDSGALLRALQNENVDVVIDTFSMTAHDADAAISAFRPISKRVVVLSSQDVYAQFGRLNGLPSPEPEPTISESSPLTIPYPFRSLAEHEGGSEYDKKEVERVYCEAAPKFEAVTLLRLPAVYGSGDYQNRFVKIIRRLDSDAGDMPSQGGANWRCSFGHVANVAHAIVLAAEAGRGGYRIFNVAEPRTPTMRERVEEIGGLMGKKVVWTDVDHLPVELSLLGRMPNDFVVETKLLRNSLQFEELLNQSDCYSDLISWVRSQKEPVN